MKYVKGTELPTICYAYFREITNQFGELSPIDMIEMVLEHYDKEITVDAMRALVTDLGRDEDREIALEWYAHYLETGERRNWGQFKEKGAKNNG